MRDGHIPETTVARLPTYLQALVDATDRGVATLSSEELASAVGMNSAKVRKDLSYLGTYGTRGVGYEVAALAREIAAALGIVEDRPVVLLGVGNLGRALASYGGFERRGFRVVALFDVDPVVVGQQVAGRPVCALDELEDVLEVHGVTMAILAIPAAHAQPMADRLVSAGIRSLLSFAPTHLKVPEHVTVRWVDLATELQILSFYERAALQFTT